MYNSSSYTAVINNNQGTITAELYPEEAPPDREEFYYPG